MSLTNFPNGITSFGCPILPSSTPEVVTGSIFFVDSNTGADTGASGGSADDPFATLDYALGKCTANKGDRIYLMPGHAQTITLASQMTMDIAGVEVIGLGRYDARPTLTVTADVSTLITAANCSIENVRFLAGVADIAVGMLITGKGFRLKSCSFEESTAALNWVDVIHVNTADNDADGLELLFNEIITADDATVTAIDILKNINDAKIIGNRIVGDFNATPYAPIYMADNEIAKNILVTHNLIHNLHDGNAAVGISMVEAVSTGWMMHNHCYALDVAGETPFLTGATGIYCSQNYYSYQATLSGFEYPAIGTLS